MRYPLALLMTLAPMLNSQAPTSTVSSQEADYDGENLQLTGDVKITHELATMTADKASIKKHEEQQGQPLSTITLEESVRLRFPAKETGVSCHFAHIDFNTLLATFQGKSQAPIVYTDTIHPKNSDEPISVQMTSQKLDAHFFEADTKADKKQYAIETLHAKESVILHYGSEWTLLTEQVDYKRPSEGPASLHGLFTATSPNEKSPCILRYGKDYQIISKVASVNLETSQLQFEKPKGTLPAYFAPESTLSFQADTLSWDQEKNHLILSGDVLIEDPSFGVMHTEREMDLQIDLTQRQPMQKLKTTGPSELIYTDSHQVKHEVLSSGPIFADHLLNQIHSQEGSAQIRYTNNDFIILADQALIQYQEEQGRVVPATLQLQGHVRLISKDAERPAKFGIAETLVYSFKERVATLSCPAGEKVLIKDEGAGMQLSAPQVRISPDTETKEPLIQGIGAVRFSFTPDEESKFKHFLTELEKMP